MACIPSPCMQVQNWIVSLQRGPPDLHKAGTVGARCHQASAEQPGRRATANPLAMAEQSLGALSLDEQRPANGSANGTVSDCSSC